MIWTYSIRNTTTWSVPTVWKPSKTVNYDISLEALLNMTTDQLHPDERGNTTEYLETLELQVFRLFLVILMVDS
jgi:hypothetical protein